MKKNKVDLKEPQEAVGGYQLAQSGLYDTSFLKHGQIQASYPNVQECATEHDEPNQMNYQKNYEKK